ncbi:S10 family peptidase [Silvibacterium dinghuense]|uniref:Peptidase S10 n=1 Tax=Silvibacterium dinghuense TaxID=1560006 RepID=A0A4Q1SH39_9BACT|nr:peptidase S10 [Silvibacterium dinghuense]RXS96667.1 peptidase S10 [Silvibacterium dinghuense]GGG92679.1 peptidase S10 [Silvibacterium dinghuense]
MLTTRHAGRLFPALLAAAAILAPTCRLHAQDAPDDKPAPRAERPHTAPSPDVVTPDSTTEGSVTVGGQNIAYRAVAGTITVGGTDPQDATIGFDGKPLPDSGVKLPDNPNDAPPTARMFYVAYFKKDAAAEHRPILFAYNGGPGSPTMWLHMGSFGPKRIVTPDTEHKEGAPYSIVSNPYSILDVADIIFIDAPGTGLSRTFGKNKAEAFYGVDGDAHAFERFIRRFLSKYDRWNSPKYLFGESYGTPRSAVLAADLSSVDLNGVILLSQILSFDNSVDGPQENPGVDQPYALALPTYAATAWYFHKLPTQPPALKPFLDEVQHFALTDYMAALLQGSELPAAQKQAIAEKLHGYTGLPTDYILRANLRVSGGEFSKTLKLDEATTIGRLDTRYQGPDMDPLSQSTSYDPQSDAITSAWNTAINSYLHNDLKYAFQSTYLMSARQGGEFSWNMNHRPPGRFGFGGGGDSHEQGTNVMADLAYRMKSNPKMKVFLAGGYYDLATPYFEGMFEMHHLPMPDSLQSNISYHYYEAGHMIYVNDEVLKQFHKDVASFIQSTESGQ